MTRKMIRSSLARSPHQAGLRSSVMVWAVVSMLSSLNGPAVTGVFLIQPVLNDVGSVLVDAG